MAGPRPPGIWKGVIAMRANARPLGHHATAQARHSAAQDPARQVNVGQLHLSALASAPFWARRYTRLFLNDCPGITEDTAETAQLIVSELVTNAARACGGDLSGREPSYSERVGLGVIRLSLRQVRDGLLIEVSDSSPEAPVVVHADRDAEHGRGLLLVEALSSEWGYFPAPNGGKVVYCFLRPSLRRLRFGRGFARRGPSPRCQGSPGASLAARPLATSSACRGSTPARAASQQVSGAA